MTDPEPHHSTFEPAPERQDGGQFSDGYGRHASLSPVPAQTVNTAGPVALHPSMMQVTEYPVSFTGTAAEFFRIWIVNVALTIVTLGIYSPWARVRTRQYFYGHTWLDGHNFEYRANPLALLKGYLLVSAFFLTYLISSQFEEITWLGVLIVVLFSLCYPWLVRQSMRFQAVNTIHRGLNFRFHGTTADAYVAYGAANLVAGITGILGLPWAWFMQRRYQLQNIAYGTARGNFRGDVGPFYTMAFKALGITLGIGVVLGILVGGLMAAILPSLDLNSRLGMTDASVVAGIVTAYLGFLLLFGVMWQYVRAAVMAYVLNNAELGGVVRARATFSPWTLMWIGITNGIAQVLTLGLATPWAAIRRTKYIMEGIQVRAIASLDDFAGGAVQGESALGEAASELLDIQVGF